MYIGKSGTGKSHRCYYDPDYRESGYKFPTQAPGKVFFDGYENQRVIWFDEFGGTVLPFSLFLRLSDKWDHRVETKGGTVLISGLRKILISTTTYPNKWWANCPKYLEDPRQLWRRLSKVYYISKVPGYYCNPITVEHPETFDDRIVSACDKEAAAEIEARESERRRQSAIDLAERLRSGSEGGYVDIHGESGVERSASVTRSESDLLGMDESEWLYDGD